MADTKVCPDCGAPVVRSTKGLTWVCSNGHQFTATSFARRTKEEAATPKKE